MINRKLPPQVAKRRRVNSSSAVQNPPLPRKKAQILDDIWLEAMKHVTWSQWSKMSLVSRQVNGVIQRNLTRLPPPVIDNARLQWELVFYVAHQKLKDVISNTEGRYIRCHSFNLNISGDIGTRPSITVLSESLKWLERNVRSDLISFPEWVSYRVHETVRARAILSDFIFGTSQKCKVQELIFVHFNYRVEFLNNLIEDFLGFFAFSVVQGAILFPDVQNSIPTVVIYRYPRQEEYRAHLGENLIRREVDSQGADALYEIENGDKRIRISFFYSGWNGEYKANVKFYTI